MGREPVKEGSRQVRNSARGCTFAAQKHGHGPVSWELLL